MSQAPVLCPVKSVNHIHRRVGHIAVVYNHYIIVWGGFRGYSDLSEQNSYWPPDSVWLLNCHTEIWSEASTKGQIPYPNSGGTGLVHDNHLYVFGGIPSLPNYEWCYSSKLYRLNLKTYVWELLEPSGDPPLGCDKGVGWLYEDRLYFFGGYGEKPRCPSSSNFSLDFGNLEGNRGWNNFLSCYDPESNSWIDVKASGIPPGPRAAHAADISGDFVFIFGGRFGEVRNNDLYVLDMKNLEWTPNLMATSLSVRKPSGRSWHSFNFVSPRHAILYGGLRHHGFPSRYLWHCSINSNYQVMWKRVKMDHPLVWHKAAYMPLTGELIIIGGVNESPYAMTVRDHVHKLFTIQLRPLSLFRLCLNAVLEMGDLPKLEGLIPSHLYNILVRRRIQKYESFIEANKSKSWAANKWIDPAQLSH